jgi:hypothetical protein
MGGNGAFRYARFCPESENVTSGYFKASPYGIGESFARARNLRKRNYLGFSIILKNSNVTPVVALYHCIRSPFEPGRSTGQRLLSGSDNAPIVR